MWCVVFKDGKMSQIMPFINSKIKNTCGGGGVVLTLAAGESGHAAPGRAAENQVISGNCLIRRLH